MDLACFEDLDGTDSRLEQKKPVAAVTLDVEALDVVELAEVLVQVD